MHNKPQEGRSIPKRMDKPHGQSRLRGATRQGSRGVSQSSIDAWLINRGVDLEREARGRRPRATAESEKPWRGNRSTSRESSRAELLGGREGAALVADPIPSTGRVPRPSGVSGGGSSGGPTARLTPLCFGSRALSLRLGMENPRSGEKAKERFLRTGVEQGVRGVETSEMQSAGDGCPEASLHHRRGISYTHPKTAEGGTSSTSAGASQMLGSGEKDPADARCRPLLSPLVCLGSERRTQTDVLCEGSPGEIADPSRDGAEPMRRSVELSSDSPRG